MGKPENLVIVESPSKAKTIGKYLGDDYVVKASMGHLRDLPKSTMGVDLEHDFTPHYIPVRGKEALIKELKTDAEKAKTVYLAPDPDREGEAISWHLKELLKFDFDFENNTDALFTLYLCICVHELGYRADDPRTPGMP